MEMIDEKERKREEEALRSQHEAGKNGSIASMEDVVEVPPDRRITANGISEKPVLQALVNGKEEGVVAKEAGNYQGPSSLPKCCCHCRNVADDNDPLRHMDKILSGLMVVASLIATVTFQAGLSPPGGIWQDDSNSKPSHKAGTSILAYENPGKDETFILLNTVGFLFSIFAIFWLILGFFIRSMCLLGFTVVFIWIALVAMVAVYAVSIMISSWWWGWAGFVLLVSLIKIIPFLLRQPGNRLGCIREWMLS